MWSQTKRLFQTTCFEILNLCHALIWSFWGFLLNNSFTVICAIALDDLANCKSDKELINWVRETLSSRRSVDERHLSSISLPAPGYQSDDASSASSVDGSTDTSEDSSSLSDPVGRSSYRKRFSPGRRRNKSSKSRKTAAAVMAAAKGLRLSSVSKAMNRSERNGKMRRTRGYDGFRSKDESNEQNLSLDGQLWWDGRLTCRLMNVLIPGSCPRPDLLDSTQHTSNVALALKLAKRFLGRKPEMDVDDFRQLKCKSLSGIKAKRCFRNFLSELQAKAVIIQQQISAAQDSSSQRSSIQSNNDQSGEFGAKMQKRHTVSQFLLGDDLLADLSSLANGEMRRRTSDSALVDAKKQSEAAQALLEVSVPFLKPQLSRQSSTGPSPPPYEVKAEGPGLKHAQQFRKAEFNIRYCGSASDCGSQQFSWFVTPPHGSGQSEKPSSTVVTTPMSCSPCTGGDFARIMDLVVDIKGPRENFCTEHLTRRSPRQRPARDAGYCQSCTSDAHLASLWRRRTFSSMEDLDSPKASSISKPTKPPLCRHSAAICLSSIPYEYEILSRCVVFRYTPQSSGEHTVSLFWGGRHIAGSPFRVRCSAAATTSVGKAASSKGADFYLRRNQSCAVMSNKSFPVDPATAKRRERFKAQRNVLSSADIYATRADLAKASRLLKLQQEADSDSAVPPSTQRQRKKNNLTLLLARMRPSSTSENTEMPILNTKAPQRVMNRQCSEESLVLRRRSMENSSAEDPRKISAEGILGGSNKAFFVRPVRGKRVLRRTVFLGQQQLELDPREEEINPAELVLKLSENRKPIRSVSLSLSDEEAHVQANSIRQQQNAPLTRKLSKQNDKLTYLRDTMIALNRVDSTTSADDDVIPDDDDDDDQHDERLTRNSSATLLQNHTTLSLDELQDEFLDVAPMAPKPEATPSRQLWRSPALSNIVVAALHSKSLLKTTEPESEPVIDVLYVPPNVPPTPPPPLPSATEEIHAAPPSREISKPRDEAAKPKLIRQRALLEEHPEETQSASQVSPTVRALSSRFEALSKSIEPSQRSCSMRDLSEKQHPQQVPAAAAEGTKLSFADLLAVWNAKDSVSRVGNSSDDELLAPKPGVLSRAQSLSRLKSNRDFDHRH